MVADIAYITFGYVKKAMLEAQQLFPEGFAFAKPSYIAFFT